MSEKKISRNIASCTGLIISRSRQTYAMIAPEHKRHIDLEDVVQEGYIAALEAEACFRPQGAKFSTFLFNRLTFRYNHEFTGKLTQQKRTSYLVELDAPLSEDSDRKLELTDDTFTPDSDVDCVEGFINVCRLLSPGAVVWFIGTLVSSTQEWERMVPTSGARSEILRKEVADAVKMQGYSRDDYSALRGSERAQKMALITLARNSSIGLGTERDARILECVECRGRFALAAIRAGRYVVQTMTCVACYQQMRKADPEESCFGKSKTPEHEGYSEKDVECTLHCRDRKVCSQFISEEKDTMKEKKSKKAAEEVETPVAEEETKKNGSGKKSAAAAAPAAKPSKKAAKVEVEEEDSEDVDIETGDDDEEEEEKPVAAKKAAKQPGKVAKMETKTEKPAKAAKTEGKAASNGNKEYPAPSEVVRWPHKTGSWMQYCFQRAYKGVKATELENETNESGRKWAIFLKVLRGGKSGMKRPTHTWRLDETGGRLKIGDVKYLGGE